MSEPTGFRFDDGAGGYAAFEDRFRGSRASVQARLGVYLPLLQAVHAIAGGGRALDIGCGRGEWLELLRDAGIDAAGCDADAGMATRSADLGLEVVTADAVDWLAGQPAGSLFAVTAFHVVEHLDPGAAQALLQEAFRALADNGVLILETPNPENLRVAGCDFHTDPTHRRPLPPALASFMVSAAGFAVVEAVRLNPHPLFAARRKAAGTELEQDLAQALYGPQDYAVIGLKADAGGAPRDSLVQALKDLQRWSERALGLSRPEGDAEALQRVVCERDAALYRADAALADCRARIAELDDQLAQARRGLDERAAQLASLRHSLSWRITAPLRLLLRTTITLRDRSGLRGVGSRLGALPRRLPATPLISCLCVTRGRPDLLARAIRCFQAQRWPARELLIVYESDDAPTRAFLSTLADPMIRVVEVPASPKLTLGELRNLAIDAARGRWFCQWDDDDWYHRDRLAAQWAVLRQARKAACVLMHWLVFDTTTGRAFISPRWHWEGSILCDREARSDGLRYASAARAEDTPFVQALAQRGELVPLVRPGLYIYVYHRRNVWDYTHWQANILDRSPHELAAADAVRIGAILDGACSVAEGSAAIDALLGRIGSDWQP